MGTTEQYGITAVWDAVSSGTSLYDFYFGIELEDKNNIAVVRAVFVRPYKKDYPEEMVEDDDLKKLTIQIFLDEYISGLPSGPSPLKDENKLVDMRGPEKYESLYENSKVEIKKLTQTQIRQLVAVLIYDDKEIARQYGVNITIPTLTQYTVKLDPNGGTVSQVQTKFHGIPLGLAPQLPYRNGYTFLGWSKSKAAYAVDYFMHGPYYDNASITLYAVWQPESNHELAERVPIKEMDWAQTDYTYSVTADLVSVTDVDRVVGSLDGVILEGLTITEGYYSDSRIQAKVSTITKIGESDGWDDSSGKNYRIRLSLNVPKRNWSRVLMTGYVSSITIEDQNGYTRRKYSLESTLWGLLNHKTRASITIAGGSYLLYIWRALFHGETRVQYDMTNAQNHMFKNTILYEGGTSLSTILFETNESYNRIGVDGYGRITFDKYIAPSKQTPSRTINVHGDRELIIGTASYSEQFDESPGRAVVTANITEDETQKTIIGYYDAPSWHPSSIDSRGYLLGRVDSYNGPLDNPSVQKLTEIAETNWKNAQTDSSEYTLNSVYADYHAGEVVQLITDNKRANNRKALIKSVTTNFDTFTQELTFKLL